MRKDMGKVLTEGGKSRPHHDQKNRNKKMREEHLPPRQGFRKALAGCYAYSNPTRKPLFNMIEGRIGQQWDKVLGEIKASLDSNNHEQMSMLDVFVKYDIETQVTAIKKVGKIKVPYNFKDDPVWSKIWVHPATGRIMKAVKRPIGESLAPDPKYIKIKGKSYRVLYSEQTITAVEEGEMDEADAQGSWFEVTLEKLEGKHEGWGRNLRFVPDDTGIMDVVAGEKANGATSLRCHGEAWLVATAKRQLSGREIKKLGLTDKFAGFKPRKTR